MRFSLILTLLTALFAGCSTNQTAPVQSSTTQNQIQQFMTAAEDKRGSALSLAEQVQVQALAMATRGSINAAQTSFLNKVGQTIGMNAATISAIYPEAGRPLTEIDAVKRIESRLGKRLSDVDQAAVKAATQLRNNTVGTLKTGLAAGIGKRIGMDAAVVEALLPLLGF